MSALGIGSGLLAMAGLFQLVIGLLVPIFGRRPGIVGLSAQTDEQMWKRPSNVLLADPVVHDLRLHHHIVLGGLLVGLGLSQAAIAIFAVSRGDTWAFLTLVLVGLGMTPYWIWMVWQFASRGVRVQPFLSLQPFVWVHWVFWLAGVIVVGLDRAT